MINTAKEQVIEYFKKNKWNSIKNKEGDLIFYKQKDPYKIKENEFLEYSKKKGTFYAADIIHNLKDFFGRNDYQIKPGQDIVMPKDYSTFFITSGIQSFEKDLIYGDVAKTRDSLFIQPVIRSNYAKNISEGKISSFVNLSTVRFNCDSEQYVKDLDKWMNFLSQIGLYLGDFNFKLKNKNTDNSSKNPWKSNDGFVITFSYGGLGLGAAGYCLMPSKTDKSFEDIGFGLERLLWARNKSPSFKEVVGVFPHLFQQDIKSIDTLRTLSLMSMFDVEKNKDGHNQFKRYLSQVESSLVDLDLQVKGYYNFWSQFFDAKKSEVEVKEYLISKINEFSNTNQLKNLGILNVPKDLKHAIFQDKDSFIRELIRINPDKLPLLRKMYK